MIDLVIYLLLNILVISKASNVIICIEYICACLFPQSKTLGLGKGSSGMNISMTNISFIEQWVFLLWKNANANLVVKLYLIVLINVF